MRLRNLCPFRAPLPGWGPECLLPKCLMSECLISLCMYPECLILWSISTWQVSIHSMQSLTDDRFCLELLPHVGIKRINTGKWKGRQSNILSGKLASIPPGIEHTEWLPGVRLRHFSPTCAVRIEDCEGWWLSSCRSSVAEHWLNKPGVLGSIPCGCRPFHFPLFSPQETNWRAYKWK